MVGVSIGFIVKQQGGTGSDPDFLIYKTSPFGLVGVSESETPSVEDSSITLDSGEYIMDISDYKGLDMACFNISID